MQDYEYRESHKGTAKAKDYDYGAYHGRYRSLVWAWEQQILKQILKSYYSGRESHLLDFACGTGRIIGFLQGQVTTTTGVDVSKSMLQIARQKILQSELILGDLTRENILGNRRFNLITAFRFFLNAQPSLRREAMQTIAKHLTDDGLLVFNNHMQRTSIMHIILRAWSLLRYGRDNKRYLSLEQIRSLVDEAGFRIIKIFHWGLLPATDNHMPLPPSLLVRLENRASRCRLLRPLAQNTIIVCAKDGASKH
jgi:predicted TPR repeat methyltransferase